MTPEEITEIRKRLAEAEAARHRLMVGEAVSLQRHDGRTLELRSVDINKLELYIQELRALLGLAKPRVKIVRMYQSGNGL